MVDNPEGAGEYLRVAPRRLGAPIPFEFARVVLPQTHHPVKLLVFAPRHAYADDVDCQPLDGDRTLAAFPLDETAKYFLLARHRASGRTLRD